MSIRTTVLIYLGQVVHNLALSNVYAFTKRETLTTNAELDAQLDELEGLLSTVEAAAAQLPSDSSADPPRPPSKSGLSGPKGKQAGQCEPLVLVRAKRDNGLLKDEPCDCPRPG